MSFLDGPAIREGAVPQKKTLTVSELTELVKGTLEVTFSDIAVVGEISNFKAHPSGHLYFSLKDEKAMISAVMFRGDGSRLRFKAVDGLKVIAFGKITVYSPRGSYQIVVSRMEPEGLGALQLAFEQLKKKLEAEGFFDQKRKRSIPRLPRRIGIVTSPSGAAIRDILNILARRFSGVEVLIYPVKVQGEGAGAEVAEAITTFNKAFKNIDVLIVGRGGGSIEDLWAFNEEVVARAIFASKIPVISAVGHEVDFTIADFVADLRAPTPSAAAELVVANKVEIFQRVDSLVKDLLVVQSRVDMGLMKLDDLRQRMIYSLERKLRDLFIEFQDLKSHLARLNPTIQLLNRKHQLRRHCDSLRVIASRLCEKRQWALSHLKSKLDLLNPRTIMDRGYSIVRIQNSMKVVKKASDVQMGDKLLIELSKGKITARV